MSVGKSRLGISGTTRQIPTHQRQSAASQQTLQQDPLVGELVDSAQEHILQQAHLFITVLVMTAVYTQQVKKLAIVQEVLASI